MCLPLSLSRSSIGAASGHSVDARRSGSGGRGTAAGGRALPRLGVLVARLRVRVAIEGVGKRDGVHVVHVAVLEQVRIDEEDDRHVGALARAQALLAEAEALDLVEIETRLERR